MTTYRFIYEGQEFDDVLAVQLARARFAVLQIQAAEKSIQAPIAIPQDVQELALGPDAIMRSANPQGIRRVPLELPPGVFTESGVLERELRLGSRYPEVRSGNVDASISLPGLSSPMNLKYSCTTCTASCTNNVATSIPSTSGVTGIQTIVTLFPLGVLK